MHGAIRLPICDFLSVFNSSIWPDSISFVKWKNLNDLKFDPSRSLKIQSNGAVGYPYMTSYWCTCIRVTTVAHVYLTIYLLYGHFKIPPPLHLGQKSCNNIHECLTQIYNMLWNGTQFFDALVHIQLHVSIAESGNDNTKFLYVYKVLYAITGKHKKHKWIEQRRKSDQQYLRFPAVMQQSQF